MIKTKYWLLVALLIFMALAFGFAIMLIIAAANFMVALFGWWYVPVAVVVCIFLAWAGIRLGITIMDKAWRILYGY